ncbi:NUDIX domain-containing protein [Pontivivens nitratireducens]|jgi:8-oxo-dGTP diphosphatase|uniref:NUDIX hydrolase n=1 Tax=Pontivivens nitratireducens TaxID=2758038 RepID=A0A6G7VIZ8_9RHOB|nr:NUDIX hydrolase [Pontibrevibacter nitratireducens]QIK40019.1 NUDIX hydrolase [Pontibrevibacter nitratireducens]
MRRFGEAIKSGQAYADRPGAYAIIADGAWLLLARTTVRDQTLLLPGGGIDKGEHPLAGLHREVIEETGWRVARPRRLGAYQRYVFMPEYGWWAHKICAVYLCHPVRQLAPPTEPDHFPVWMRATDAAERLSVGAERHFVRRQFRI